MNKERIEQWLREGATGQDIVRKFRFTLAQYALYRSEGNATQAAKFLRIHRNVIADWLKEEPVAIEETEESRERREHKEKVEKFANSYCMGTVPGGMFGERTCQRRIPITERYCEECKARRKAEGR